MTRLYATSHSSGGQQQWYLRSSTHHYLLGMTIWVSTVLSGTVLKPTVSQHQHPEGMLGEEPREEYQVDPNAGSKPW